MDITHIGFKPPADQRLPIEALTVDDLRRRAPEEHFRKLQRADFFRLFGVREGCTTPEVDFSHHALRAADWLLVRPGQVFRYDFEQPWSGWMVVFPPQVIMPGPRMAGRDEVDLSGRLESLPTRMPLEPMQHGWMCASARQLQLDGLLRIQVPLRNELLRLQLAGMLLRLSACQPQVYVPSAREEPFQRFRLLLEADHANRHQVGHYARALGMSDKTLRRVCLAATGMPAKAVINQRRLLEAKRLLAHTRLSVKAVGHALGFDEPTHFVRFFRREAGMSPLAFRLAEKS